MTTWLCGFDVVPTFDGAGNLVRLEYTTARDLHPYGLPEDFLDPLAEVARVGSRFDVYDGEGDIAETRRVLVDNGGRRRWVVAHSAAVFGDPHEMSREASRLLRAALDEETGDPAWRDLVALALSLVEGFRVENEWM